MCGRFALGFNIEDMPQQFNETALNNNSPFNEVSNGVYETTVEEGSENSINVQFDISRVNEWRPSYNIAPTNTALMIYMVRTDPGEGVDYKYIVEPSKFGMVPIWAKPKDPTPSANGGKYSRELQRHQSKYFNCRKESLAQHQAIWNSSRKNKRCVIPIQGYFEWIKSKTDKKPYYVHSKSSSIVYLAGLYAHNLNYTENRNVNGEYLSTFTICTGPANHSDEYDISWLHSRKPIFLKPGTKDWYDWLNPDHDWDDKLLDTSLEVAHNQAYKDIEGYPVSNDVGKPANKGENIIKPNKAAQKSISSFFSPVKKRVKDEKPERDNKRVKTEDERPHTRKDAEVKEEEKQDSKPSQGTRAKKESIEEENGDVKKEDEDTEDKDDTKVKKENSKNDERVKKEHEDNEEVEEKDENENNEEVEDNEENEENEDPEPTKDEIEDDNKKTNQKKR
ncbi:uncharacterized protein RJT20DRAFT_43425 [Scheffersomyces xylosifermentans]|uniref:uncharacterized protein n=1 Tax=Scheffersomyces xylosifermentans TaxID=1304137 RepID=UPI00315CF881